MFANIFVLCTGRCGSTTFIAAAKHLKNYTAEHESRCRHLGTQRFAYPAFHIEADNRLSWLLGRLEDEFGNSAFYVHLTRDEEATAKSYAKREGGIMEAYQGMGIIMGCQETDRMLIAKDYVNTVTSNIRHFLRDKTNKMHFRLENAERDFTRFCSMVGAQGNMKRALAEFDIKHNAS